MQKVQHLRNTRRMAGNPVLAVSPGGLSLCPTHSGMNHPRTKEP